MIQIFCSERGAGKTKRLIEMANSSSRSAKGNVVFIDDDNTNARLIDRRIRFVSADEFDIKGCKAFYGFLSGIISNNYDIEKIYIDGLLSMIDCSLENTKDLFFKLSNLCKKYSVKLFINVNSDIYEEIPHFIKQYA